MKTAKTFKQRHKIVKWRDEKQRMKQLKKMSILLAVRSGKEHTMHYLIALVILQ